MITLILSAVLFFSYFIKFYIDNKKFFDFAKTRKALGPPFFPIIGSLYTFLGNTINDNYQVYTHMQKKYSFPASFWLKHSYYYFTGEAEELKIIFNSPHSINKALIYNGELDHIIENSVFILRGKLWRERRKLYMKSLKPNVVKKIVPVMYERSQYFLEDIKHKKANSCLYYFCDFYFSKTIFAILFGYGEEELEGVNDFTKNILSVQDAFSRRLLDVLVPSKIWLNFFPEGRKTMKMIKEITSFIMKAIQRSSNNNTEFKVLPLLDLFTSEKSMTDKSICEELFLFVGAATDTSGHTLAWSFTLLGMFPDIQEKVYQEIRSVAEDGPIQFEDLSKLQYTECVVQETLRLFPVVPIVGRYLTNDISLGNSVLPKGANVALCIFDAHLNEKYWVNPLKFDPSRFLPENSKNIVPYSFLPFVGGARDCVGKGLALTQLKMTLANVVRSFRIESSHKSMADFEFISTVTLKTKNPLDCRFYERHTN